MKVRDVASTQLFTIGPRQDLDEALRMMANIKSAVYQWLRQTVGSSES